MGEGHCLLVPREHTPNLPASDETVAREMLDIRRKLTAFFKLSDREPVFITTATRTKGFPHFVTECVPIDLEEAEFAPMYFQKAFQDAEGPWATNKAVVNTMKEQSHYKKVPHQLGNKPHRLGNISAQLYLKSVIGLVSLFRSQFRSRFYRG